ncbi:hypothetical protein E4U43_006958, partial [Claviceps pusilla]
MHLQLQRQGGDKATSDATFASWRAVDASPTSTESLQSAELRLEKEAAHKHRNTSLNFTTAPRPQNSGMVTFEEVSGLILKTPT